MEVSRLRSGRLSEKKNYPFTLLHGPLSARGERQSHPLAGQAQACGRPTQVEGPGARWHLTWPLADTTAQKNSICACHPCACPCYSVSLQAKTPRNYVRRPCAGVVLVLIVSSLYVISNHSPILDLCMADKHQYSSSRASAADGQSTTSDRVSSQQMTPMHSHSSRRSSSRPRLKEVCACIWRTGTQQSRPSSSR